MSDGDIIPFVKLPWSLLQRSAKPPWQISLRSLLVLTAMAAVMFAWWRAYSRNLPFWGSLIGHWSGWVTIATTIGPFLLPIGGLRIQSRGQVEALLKLCVFLAAINTVHWFVDSVMVVCCTDQRRLGAIVQESFAISLWFCFPLQTALAAISIASISRPELRPRIRAYALVVLVVVNVFLLNWFVPFVITAFYTNNWR